MSKSKRTTSPPSSPLRPLRPLHDLSTLVDEDENEDFFRIYSDTGVPRSSNMNKKRSTVINMNKLVIESKTKPAPR